MNEALERALQIVGSQTSLGRAVGYSQASVYKWLYNRLKVPPEVVPLIVEMTGGQVKAYELRPDLPQLFPHPVDSDQP